MTCNLISLGFFFRNQAFQLETMKVKITVVGHENISDDSGRSVHNSMVAC